MVAGLFLNRYVVHAISAALLNMLMKLSLKSVIKTPPTTDHAGRAFIKPMFEPAIGSENNKQYRCNKTDNRKNKQVFIGFKGFCSICNDTIAALEFISG